MATCIYCKKIINEKDTTRPFRILNKERGYAHEDCKAGYQNDLFYYSYMFEEDDLKNIYALLSEEEKQNYENNKILPDNKVKKALNNDEKFEKYLKSEKARLLKERVQNYKKHMDSISPMDSEQAIKLKNAVIHLVKSRNVTKKLVNDKLQNKTNKFDASFTGEIINEKIPLEHTDEEFKIRLIYGDVGQTILSPLLMINDLTSQYYYKLLEKKDVIIKGESGLYGYDGNRIFYSFKYVLDAGVTKDNFNTLKQDLWYLDNNGKMISAATITTTPNESDLKNFYRRLLTERPINSQSELEYFFSNNNIDENKNYIIELYSEQSNYIILDSENASSGAQYAYTSNRKYYQFKYKINDSTNNPITINNINSLAGTLFYKNNSGQYISVSKQDLSSEENIKNFLNKYTTLYIRELVEADEYGKITSQTVLNKYIKVGSSNWDATTNSWKIRIYTSLDIATGNFIDSTSIKQNNNGYQIQYADAKNNDNLEITPIPAIFNYEKLRGTSNTEGLVEDNSTPSTEAIEGLIATYRTEPRYWGSVAASQQTSYCKSDCMGLCTDSCSDTCSTKCTGSCKSGCTSCTSCSGTCSNRCSGCYGCGGCGSSCGGCTGCRGCGSACSSCGSCGSGCTGCGGGCKHTSANTTCTCGGCGSCGGFCSGSYNE